MKFGITLGALNPGLHRDVTVLADQLGFESVWMPEHLIFTQDLAGSPHPGAEAPPVPPTTPVYDAFAWLSWLAGQTEQIRLGTNVYLLGLRHPFVAARAVQTLDVVSGGRALLGVGAGWLREEWVAAGLDPAKRGRRLDEALAVCKRLWSESPLEHHGEFFDFGPVVFEPKPLQRPWPPICAGGESEAALKRAAWDCDGWMGLQHSLESAAPLIARVQELRRERELESEPFEISLGGAVKEREDIRRWADAGVDRLMVAPWKRSREAIDGLKRFADLVGGEMESA